MTRIARKADGRRIFTARFKREQIGRVLNGELSLAELSRKLGIAPSLLHRWKRLMPRGDETADVAEVRPPPVHILGTAQYIRELQLLVGKQTVELELLRAEVYALRKRKRPLGAPLR